MIPKVIHLTWFGSDPFPPLVEKCVASWKKYLPDYKIIIWDSTNFDINMNMWVSEAYAAKKYAFVADYARIYLLYKYGGIYLDADVEVKRNMDELLNQHAFFSFTAKKRRIQAETIGSEPHQEMIKKILDYYQNRHFILGENTYDVKTIDEILYDLLVAEGLSEDKVDQIVSGIHIYPPGYFLMSDDLFYLSYHESIYYLKERYTLHYAIGSWGTVQNKSYLFLKNNYIKYFWTICKLIQNPAIFYIWKKLINMYRNVFWGDEAEV